MPIDDTARLVCSLVAGELDALRAGGFERAERLRWDRSTPLGASGVGVDSLELIGVATAISDFFNLHTLGCEDRLLVDRTIGGWCLLAEQALDAPGGGLTFRTSGSTDHPKAITHGMAEIRAEASGFASRIRGVRRVVTLVPAHHMYGYIHGLLVPRELDVGVVDAEFMVRSGAMRRLVAGDLVVATPSMWGELLRTGLRFPSGVRGVSSGAPMPTELWEQLLAQGLDKLTDVYGATETGALGVREHAGEPFRAIGTPEKLIDIQDAINWVDGSRFVVRGRLDGCVQVQGVNVSTSAVEGVLLEHRGVREASARLRPGDTGARIEAFVVPSASHDPADDLVASLKQHVAARLPAAARPVTYTLGPAIPLSPLGKPAPWRCSA